MARRIFASSISFAFVLLVLQPDTVRADGCEVLKDLVRMSVHASATEFAVDYPARGLRTAGRAGAVGSTFAGRQTCSDTTAVTTRAFSQALAALNMPVSWGRGPMNPGDYCLSGDLSQCYPSHNPLNPALPPNQTAFVYDSWKGVRRAVASQMPYGTITGVSQFTPVSLDAALSSNLRSAVDGPLYSSYLNSNYQKQMRQQQTDQEAFARR